MIAAAPRWPEMTADGSARRAVRREHRRTAAGDDLDGGPDLAVMAPCPRARSGSRSFDNVPPTRRRAAAPSHDTAEFQSNPKLIGAGCSSDP
jgi:hypothetical protein